MYSVFTSLSCTLYFNMFVILYVPFQKTVHSYREAFEQMESALLVLPAVVVVYIVYIFPISSTTLLQTKLVNRRISLIDLY